MIRQVIWVSFVAFALLITGCGPAETTAGHSPLTESWPTPQVHSAPPTLTPFPRVTVTLATGSTRPVSETTATPVTLAAAAPGDGPPRLPTSTPASHARVVAWALNVRQGPGLDYAVVAGLERGETVPIISSDETNGWLQVRLSDGAQAGWISGKPEYVSVEGQPVPNGSETTPWSPPRPSTGAAQNTPAEGDSGARNGGGSSEPAVEVRAAEVSVFDRPGGRTIGLLSRGDVRPILALDPGATFALVSLVGARTGWIPLTGDAVRLFSGLDLPEEPRPGFSRPAPAEGLTGRLALQTVSGGDIYLIRADGAGLRRVTHGIDPQLSPDGTRIAFTRWQPRYELFTINIDGSGERAWTHGRRQIKSPTWSADGSRLVFSFQSGGRLTDDQVRINLVERALEGEGPPEIPGRARNIEIDGPYLKYTLPMDAHWYLGQINLDTGRYTDLPAGRYSYGPTWHPSDPNLLVYKAEQTVGLYDARTGTARPLTNDPHDHSPVISPDGSRLAVSYWQHDHWEMHVMNIDGSQRQRLTRTPARFTVAAGRSWHNAAPAWSPDGNKIAFVTDRSGRWEIWVMNWDGSDQQPMFSDEVYDRLQLHYNGVDERMISWR